MRVRPDTPSPRARTNPFHPASRRPGHRPPPSPRAGLPPARPPSSPDTTSLHDRATHPPPTEPLAPRHPSGGRHRRATHRPPSLFIGPSWSLDCYLPMGGCAIAASQDVVHRTEPTHARYVSAAIPLRELAVRDPRDPVPPSHEAHPLQIPAVPTEAASAAASRRHWTPRREQARRPGRCGAPARRRRPRPLRTAPPVRRRGSVSNGDPATGGRAWRETVGGLLRGGGRDRAVLVAESASPAPRRACGCWQLRACTVDECRESLHPGIVQTSFESGGGGGGRPSGVADPRRAPAPRRAPVALCGGGGVHSPCRAFLGW